MPIRFPCQRCEQLLGIASRKAGSEIDCPKCGLTQTVPSPEAAAVGVALRSSHGNSNPVATESDFAVYDDAPEAVELAPKRRRTKAPPAQPAGTDSPGPPPVREAKQRRKPREASESSAPTVPGGMILFPRRTLYVQGALVVFLALVFFGAGYFIGRGNATFELKQEHEAALQERTLVEGRIVYRPEPQRVVGDERAVIVALPSGVRPEPSISIHGIRPQDPDPPGSLRSLRLLEELGGAYTRADAEGRFDLIVPDRGDYHILIISRNVGRPRGTDPDEADLMEMGHYFTSPERLISRYKYRWARYEVHGGLMPIEIDFGGEEPP